MGLKTLRGVIKGDDHGNNDPDKEATNLLEGKLVKKELTREANVEIGSDT